MMVLLLAAAALAGPPEAEDAAGPLEGLPLDGLPGLRPVVPAPPGAGGFDPLGIVNGSRSGDRPNVVALAGLDTGTGTAQVFCTGSVIQRTWILTAAHCLTGSSEIEQFGLDLHVLWGNDIYREGYTHASPWKTHYTFPGYTDAVFANDIGLIELSEPIPDWAPLTVLNDEPLSEDWVGSELTFVGFGDTSDGAFDVGTMREAVIPITGYDEQYIYAFSGQSNVCQGDSGGPSFREVDGHLEQVGVNAYVTPGCVGGSSGSTNIVEFLDFVTDHVPDVLFEPAPEGPAAGEGFDVGVADAFTGPGIGMRFPGREGPGPAGGCSTTGSPAVGGWLMGLAALLRRRRS